MQVVTQDTKGSWGYAEPALCGNAATSGCQQNSSPHPGRSYTPAWGPLLPTADHLTMLFCSSSRTSPDSHKEPRDVYYAYSSSLYLSKSIH